MSSIIFGFLPLQQVDTTHHVGHAFYLALIRSAWNYALVWPIFSCVHGKGGIVKWFLDLPAFQPLGRMGLSFFLVSGVYRQYIPQMQPEHFSNRNNVIKLNWKFGPQILNIQFSAPSILRGLCCDIYSRRNFVFSSWSTNFEHREKLFSERGGNGCRADWKAHRRAAGNHQRERKTRMKKINEALCARQR